MAAGVSLTSAREFSILSPQALHPRVPIMPHFLPEQRSTDSRNSAVDVLPFVTVMPYSRISVAGLP